MDRSDPSSWLPRAGNRVSRGGERGAQANDGEKEKGGIVVSG